MLLQSHNGILRLLPALPRSGPPARRAACGPPAGAVVDLDWHDGRLIRARILVRRPARAREFTVPRASGKPGLVAQDTGLTVPSAQHGDGGRS